MPSWVPDWTHLPRVNPLTYNGVNKYRASGEGELCIRTEPMSHVLSCATVKVDEIAQLGPSRCHCTHDDNVSIGWLGSSLEIQSDAVE